VSERPALGNGSELVFDDLVALPGWFYLHAEGLTHQQVADALGFSKMTVFNWLKRDHEAAG
jgi:hypothetical protein